MRVFKPMYRDHTGRYKEIRRWWVALRDSNGTARKFPAFNNRAESERLGRKLEELVAAKFNGGVLTPELARWLKELPRDFQQRLVKAGLIDVKQAAAGKFLAEHVTDFEEHLLAKGRTEKHIAQVINELKRVFAVCGFVYWHDISASRLESYLSDLRDKGRGISARSFNRKLKYCQHFCRWMVKDHRASESPIAHLSCLNAKLDRRRCRRVLKPDEIRHLLSSTRAAETRYGMTGHERCLLYRLCVETGLRAGEVRGLTVSDFNWQTCTVSVDAAYSKRRRNDVLPLRSDTAAELKSYLSNKLPSCRAFNVPIRTADMLRSDLAAAGIPYEISGQVFDFHALRHEAGTLLASAGVHPKVAQSVLRHSDINLTLSLYSHTLCGQESQAVESLPDFSVGKNENRQEQSA